MVLSLALRTALVVYGAPLDPATLQKPHDTRPRMVSIVRGHKLRQDAAHAFALMWAAAQADGVRLPVRSSLRTRAQQRRLHERYRRGYGSVAAPPGRSNHERGVALDIAVRHLHSRTYQWLAAHARTFGFVRTVASEPWHWEFRG